MTSRKIIGVLVFLVPLALGAMAGGWFLLLQAAHEELEVSPSVQSLGWMVWLATLGGIAGLVAGPLVDWKGSRSLIVAGGLVMSLGLLIFSTASSLPIAVTGGILASAGVGLAGGIAIEVLVANWFIQYRGTFLGLVLLGSGLGSMLAPVVGLLVEVGGWRIAARVLALGGVGVAVAGFTLIHSYPQWGEEDDPNKVRVPGRRSPQLERIIPANQYIKSPRLWPALGFLALASAGVLLVRSVLPVMVKWDAYVKTGRLASPLESLLAIGSVVGGLAWSVAADFWARSRLLWLSGSGAVVLLMLLFFFFSSLAGFGTEALLFLAGLFLGGLNAIIRLTFVDYVGVRLLGSLSMIFGLLASVGTIIGPTVAGLFIRAFGMQWSFLMEAPVIVLAVLAAIMAPYPAVELERPPLGDQDD